MPAAEPDLRTVVVPESFFEAIGVRLLKDFGANAGQNLLYEIGQDAGRLFVRGAEKAMQMKIRSEIEFRGLLRTFGERYRWADIETKLLDVPGKFAVVSWRNGIAVPRRGSPVPVCHLGRGLLSGAAGVVFEAACDAIETQCQAMGADHCEIVVGVPERVSVVAEEVE